MCDYLITKDNRLYVCGSKISINNTFASLLAVAGNLVTVLTTSGERQTINVDGLKFNTTYQKMLQNCTGIEFKEVPAANLPLYSNVLKGLVFIKGTFVHTKFAEQVKSVQNLGLDRVVIDFKDGRSDVFIAHNNATSIKSITTGETHIIEDELSDKFYCNNGLMQKIPFKFDVDDNVEALNIYLNYVTLSCGKSFYTGWEQVRCVYQHGASLFYINDKTGGACMFEPRSYADDRLMFDIHPTGLLIYNVGAEVFVSPQIPRHKVKAVRGNADSIIIEYRKTSDCVAETCLLKNSKYFKCINPNSNSDSRHLYIYENYVFRDINVIYQCLLDGEFYDHTGIVKVPKYEYKCPFSGVSVVCVANIVVYNRDSFALNDIVITTEIATTIASIDVNAADFLFNLAITFTNGTTKCAFLSNKYELMFEDGTVAPIRAAHGEPKYCRYGRYELCTEPTSVSRRGVEFNGIYIVFPNVDTVKDKKIYTCDGNYLLEHQDEKRDYFGIVTIKPPAKRSKAALKTD